MNATHPIDLYVPATPTARSPEATSERDRVPSVEVTIFWGTDILRVDHLTPPRAYHIGPRVSCDCVVPCDALGADRVPIVADTKTPRLVVVPGSVGSVELSTGRTLSLAEFIGESRTHPSDTFPGAFEVELPRGARARLEVPETMMAFEVTVFAAARAVGRGLLATVDAGALAALAASLVLHVGIVAVLALFMPRLVDDDGEGGQVDLALIQRLLGASGSGSGEASDGDGADGLGAREGDDGMATDADHAVGKQTATREPHPLAFEGPAENADPHLARRAALRQAAEFGMIGLLAGDLGGAPDAPTVSWGRADSSGRDRAGSLGGAWTGDTGDTFGAAGLAISGVGEGGGGRGEGINIGAVGTVGHGRGENGGEGFGCGCSEGMIRSGHQAGAPSILSTEAALVSGRLPPSVIQRIVRQNFGRFRLCYEDGLRTNASLQGRVAVKFVIDRGGSVAVAADGGSDLPDPAVVSCVVKSFANLSFPEPAGGIVSVLYPITLSPAL